MSEFDGVREFEACRDAYLSGLSAASDELNTLVLAGRVDRQEATAVLARGSRPMFEHLEKVERYVRAVQP